MIASAIHLPLPGCPTINGGLQWTLWIPPSVFEIILFAFALQKAIASSTARIKLNGRFSLTVVLLGDHVIYFIGITILLILNNLMAVSATHVPWFSMAPFHGLLGIATSRIMITFYKFADTTSLAGQTEQENSAPLDFLRSIRSIRSPRQSAGDAPFTNPANNFSDSEDYLEDESIGEETSPATPMLRSANDLEANAGSRSREPSSSSPGTLMSYLRSHATSSGPSISPTKFSIV